MFEYICLFDRQQTPDMLDNFDNTTMLEPVPSEDFETLSSKYDALLSFYSVRTNNVLQTLMASYPDKRTFLDNFIKMSRKEIAELRNCGRKTIEEILAIQSILNPTHEGQHTDDSEYLPKSLPANVDSLLPLVMPRLESLSVRAKNGFIIFLEDNHNSLREIHAAVTNPNFNPVKMKNVGRNTADEIMEFMDGVVEFLESFPDEQAVEEAVTKFFTKTLDDLSIPVEAQDEIRSLESSLGYFPLFAAINAYLGGLEGEERSIIDGCVLVHEDQSLQDREEVASIVGLSPERVRQKRNKLIESLAEYFASYRTFGFVDKCQYDYQMRRINEDINAAEGTDFSLHFVNWVLASVFPEVTLLGDVMRTLTGYYEKNFFICLVPTDLCQYIDFGAFLEDVDARLAERRIDEVKVPLQNLINNHLKTQYCEDEMPAIETACRSILFLHYPVEVDFGQVIFKPNARKNNPIVVEEIIRAAGHPLTLEDIYEEFIYQYPERYTEMNSLRGSINNNPNIIPIGRTSTYTLAEWESDEHRGGSIRGIVTEFLSQQEPTLASVPALVEYVCKFRPSTDEKNIISNLSLERSGTFGFYYCNGERYVGLSAGEYPKEYFPTESSAKTSAANSIWYPKVLSFVEEKGRFPFSSGVDDEERLLCRFWIKQERLYATGELDPHALKFFELITSHYGHLRDDRVGLTWNQLYERVKTALETKDFSEMDDDAGKWLARSLREYQYHKDSMPDWKRESVEQIISLFSGNEQCIR